MLFASLSDVVVSRWVAEVLDNPSGMRAAVKCREGEDVREKKIG